MSSTKTERSLREKKNPLRTYFNEYICYYTISNLSVGLIIRYLNRCDMPKQIPLLIQSCRQRYRYFTAKNIGRISTYKNKRCILGVFHLSCNAFLLVFIAPPRDLTQHSYRPIVKQPHFVKQPTPFLLCFFLLL